MFNASSFVSPAVELRSGYSSNTTNTVAGSEKTLMREENLKQNISEIERKKTKNARGPRRRAGHHFTREQEKNHVKREASTSQYAAHPDHTTNGFYIAETMLRSGSRV